MQNFKSFLNRWGAAILMMLVIFGFSATPAKDLPNFNWADVLVKKGGHMLGYGLLGLSYLRGLRGKPDNDRRASLMAWGLAVLYAVTDEFHQSFVPGRHPSPVDVLIDGIGAAGLLFVWLRYHHGGIKKRLKIS
jgi:VanZ family protein